MENLHTFKIIHKEYYENLVKMINELTNIVDHDAVVNDILSLISAKENKPALPEYYTKSEG